VRMLEAGAYSADADGQAESLRNPAPRRQSER
jgi:hypothetical protein